MRVDELLSLDDGVTLEELVAERLKNGDKLVIVVFDD